MAARGSKSRRRLFANRFITFFLSLLTVAVAMFGILVRTNDKPNSFIASTTAGNGLLDELKTFHQSAVNIQSKPSTDHGDNKTHKDKPKGQSEEEEDDKEEKNRRAKRRQATSHKNQAQSKTPPAGTHKTDGIAEEEPEKPMKKRRRKATEVPKVSVKHHKNETMVVQHTYKSYVERIISHKDGVKFRQIVYNNGTVTEGEAETIKPMAKPEKKQLFATAKMKSEHMLDRTDSGDTTDDIVDSGRTTEGDIELAKQRLREKLSQRQDQRIGTARSDHDARKIADPLMNPRPNATSLSIFPAVNYLGLLLDAGRHYFPETWLYNLVDLLSRLNFNLLHFRLTDDQAFNIRLDSHPELANPADKANGQIYTPQFLRNFVKYALEKGIKIMPEINIPGHAGSWAGKIPRIVVPCAEFICDKGYGIPLNITHPDLMQIVEDVIREVRGIFTTSPYIHLGGDEVHMSLPCFMEAGIKMYDYNGFEGGLRRVLAKLGIPESNVVRWQMTGQENVTERVKGIDHFWLDRTYVELPPNPPVFASSGLYFDTNGEDDGFVIYDKTKAYLEIESYKPIAIEAATFELGTQFWMDRNVVGRLVAVAMGAANETYGDYTAFSQKYIDYCMQVGLGGDICKYVGAPLVSENFFKDHWRLAHQSWKSMLCKRLTDQRSSLQMVGAQRFRYSMGNDASIEFFWNTFDRKFDYFVDKYTLDYNVTVMAKLDGDMEKLQQHSPNYTGVIIDLVEDGSYTEVRVTRIMAIIDYLAQLGFNLLQLRIMSDFGFAIGLQKQRFMFGTKGSYYTPYALPSIRAIIRHATLRGMEVMPEISVTTRAGGWHNVAPLTACPNHYCSAYSGLSLNTSDPTILPIILSVVKELQADFTSPYIHLGYDERRESQACYDEAKMTPNFDSFERKIERLLEFSGIQMDKILRWQNTEQIDYPSRAGKVTHYRVSDPKPVDGEEFFMTNDLILQDPDTKHETAWHLYQYVQRMVKFKPTGVLAWIGSIRDESLKGLNIRQRLLAMSIGLSHDGLDFQEFSLLFSSTCTAARNRQCEQFGRLRDADAVRKYQSESYRNQQGASCKIRTRAVTVTTPKLGVLVSRENTSLDR